MSADKELLEHILNAHGGLEKWRNYESLTARLNFTGYLWKIKGYDGMLDDNLFKIKLHEQKATFPDFPSKGLTACFVPEMVTVVDQEWNVADHLFNPGRTMKGHLIRTPWQLLQFVYFTAYATWNYLTAPFNFTLPGTRIELLSPWEEDGELLQRLAVNFPPGFAAHNRRQIYFFDAAGFLRRHHYFPETLGGAPAVQFVGGYQDFSGIKFPTERKVFMLSDDGSYLPDPVLAGLRVSDIFFEQ